MIHSCAICKYGLYFEDRSVGIFGRYTCNHPTIPDDYCDKYLEEDSHSDCAYFVSIQLTFCPICNKPMFIDLVDAKYVCDTEYCTIYPCSEECLAVARKHYAIN